MGAQNVDGTGEGYELREYLSRRSRSSATATLDGTGDGIATFERIPGGYSAHLRRLTFSGSSAGVARVYTGSRGDDVLIAVVDLTTPNGGQQVSFPSGEAALVPGESLVVEWDGGTAAAVVTVAARFDLLETVRVAVNPPPKVCAKCAAGLPGYHEQHDGGMAQDVEDDADEIDRDPLEPGGVGARPRRDADRGFGAPLPTLPSDPSTPAGSDWF